MFCHIRPPDSIRFVVVLRTFCLIILLAGRAVVYLRVFTLMLSIKPMIRYSTEKINDFTTVKTVKFFVRAKGFVWFHNSRKEVDFPEKSFLLKKC